MLGDLSFWELLRSCSCTMESINVIDTRPAISISSSVYEKDRSSTFIRTEIDSTAHGGAGAYLRTVRELIVQLSRTHPSQNHTVSNKYWRTRLSNLIIKQTLMTDPILNDTDHRRWVIPFPIQHDGTHPSIFCHTSEL